MSRLLARIAAGAALLLLAAPAGAQERIAVRREPGLPVVAAEVLIAVGPSDEPEGDAGIAYLTARSVLDPIRPLLDSLGAHVEIHAHKDAIAFSMVSAPETWEEVSRAVMVAIFRDPVDSIATERQRRRMAAELTARATNPSDALLRETDRAVYGDHPWGRPTVGTPRTVRSITVSDVDGFLRSAFNADRSVVAVVGPVEADEVSRHLASWLAPGPLRRGVDDPPSVAADSMVDREYDFITAWVGASYPFGRDADVEALRLLAALAVARVSPGPSRRSVYNARSEVVRHAAGGEVRFQLVVPPAEAERWAEELRAAVAAHAEAPLSPGIFAERVRRWRGSRLLELETPEARAEALARELFVSGRASATLVDVDALTPARVHGAAKSLGAPVNVFLGPARAPAQPAPAQGDTLR